MHKPFKCFTRGTAHQGISASVRLIKDHFNCKMLNLAAFKTPKIDVT